MTKQDFLAECRVAAYQLELQRCKKGPQASLMRGFYVAVAEYVWDICWMAIEDRRNGTKFLRTTSAPAGSGKSTFAAAAAIALARLGYSALLVVNQIEKADNVFREIEAVLPGKAAVWTAEHDPDCKAPKAKRKLKDGPARTFTKDDLADYPIVVVTHKLYTQVNAHKAKLRADGSKRLLTLIDEKLDTVRLHTVTFKDVDTLRNRASLADRWTAAGVASLAKLHDFMKGIDDKGPGIETKDAGHLDLVQKLWWFETADARKIERSSIEGDDEIAANTIGFARCFANGFGFVTRGGNLRFTAWEMNFEVEPGSVLLDATADIDGMSGLKLDWRVETPAPVADYSNLTVKYEQPEFKGRLKKYLADGIENIRDYVSWMKATILKHVTPGQKALIVTRKDLVYHGHVPREDHEWGRGWHLEGRQVCVTWWGDGIGYNSWSDCEVILLFDEFYIPKDAVIATVQGLRGHWAHEGAVSSMKALTSRHDEVDALWQGHLLRWLKQMACRGNVRNFYADGRCGEMTLVFAASLDGCRRLTNNLVRLFPDCPGVQGIDKIKGTVGRGRTGLTRGQKVLAFLADADTPTTVTTTWMAEKLSLNWARDGAKILKDIRHSLASIGREYIPGRGRSPGVFCPIP